MIQMSNNSHSKKQARRPKQTLASKLHDRDAEIISLKKHISETDPLAVALGENRLLKTRLSDLEALLQTTLTKNFLYKERISQLESLRPQERDTIPNSPLALIPTPPFKRKLTMTPQGSDTNQFEEERSPYTSLALAN
jgi:hypothetical protein